MEAMLGICLYSYLYLKLAKKCYFFLIISYVFSSTKMEKKADRFCLQARRMKGQGTGGEVDQTMYARMNKCINN
jgi:hypothetical protein